MLVVDSNFNWICSVVAVSFVEASEYFAAHVRAECFQFNGRNAQRKSESYYKNRASMNIVPGAAIDLRTTDNIGMTSCKSLIGGAED